LNGGEYGALANHASAARIQEEKPRSLLNRTRAPAGTLAQWTQARVRAGEHIPPSTASFLRLSSGVSSLQPTRVCRRHAKRSGDENLYGRLLVTANGLEEVRGGGNLGIEGRRRVLYATANGLQSVCVGPISDRRGAGRTPSFLGPKYRLQSSHSRNGRWQSHTCWCLSSSHLHLGP